MFSSPDGEDATKLDDPKLTSPNMSIATGPDDIIVRIAQKQFDLRKYPDFPQDY